MSKVTPMSAAAPRPRGGVEVWHIYYVYGFRIMLIYWDLFVVIFERRNDKHRFGASEIFAMNKKNHKI